MQNRNNNFKNRISDSIHNSPNEFRARSRNRIHFGAVISTRARRGTNSYSRIVGWSFAILIIFGLFSYLTFIPSQTFAESLIVDENEKRSLSQIDTMQEMSQQICINSRENETKQLRDTRDDKVYWVTKLKDGNCWMTQNLDYDLSNDKKIVDIKDWRSTGSGGKVDKNTEAYYDPGNYVFNLGDKGYNGNCTSDTWSNCTVPSNPQFREALNITNNDAHYLIGNYYSWNAAVDGTGFINGAVITVSQASGSICPKGWNLPTGSTNGDFEKLMKAYGWTSNAVDNALTMNNGRGIYSDPLYFVYGGRLYHGQITVAGSFGMYWSSMRDLTYLSEERGYLLNFYYDTVYPDAGNTDFNVGQSIRCLATGGWLDSYPEYSDTGNANISVTVSPVISIDATSSMTSDVDFTTIANGSITADISSNMAYQVLLSTIQTALERNPQVENNNIPMITIDQDITAGTSSWGIKKKLSATTGQPGDITNASVYSPIGITNTETGEDNKVLFFRSATAEKRTLDFSVGIAVDPKLPSGTYSTEVTITAVAM